MSLSKKEKERIDKIEDAVEKEKPVEDLSSERRKRKFEKQFGKAHVMGETIPLEKRRPGLAKKLISSTLPLFSPTLMGLFIPPLMPGKRKPKKDDESSEKAPKPRPERKKKKTGGDGDDDK